MIKLGIVGGTGCTGVERLRRVAQGPKVELAAIASRSNASTVMAGAVCWLADVDRNTEIGMLLAEPDSYGLAGLVARTASPMFGGGGCSASAEIPVLP